MAGLSEEGKSMLMKLQVISWSTLVFMVFRSQHGVSRRLLCIELSVRERHVSLLEELARSMCVSPITYCLSQVPKGAIVRDSAKPYRSSRLENLVLTLS